MKTKLLILMCMIFLSGNVMAYVCQDETDVEDVPCDIITPVLDCAASDENMTITNSADSTESYNYSMSAVGDGTYNTTFNFTGVGDSYSLKTCDDWTASITLGHFDEDYNDKWLYFYGTSLLAGVGLFFMGLKREDNLLIILSGLPFIAFALVFTRVGYPTLYNTTLKTSIILISWAIGVFFTLGGAIEFAKEGLG